MKQKGKKGTLDKVKQTKLDDMHKKACLTLFILKKSPKSKKIEKNY